MNKIYYKIKYKGLKLSSRSKVFGSGKFFFGKNNIIDDSCVINIRNILHIGDNNIFLDNLQVDASKIRLGSEISVQRNSILIGEIDIGSYCVFGPNLYISSASHHFKQNPPMNIRDQDEVFPKEHKIIIIEEDCWIGINVTFLPGVVIGKGAVIAANSVVTSNVDAYEIYGGVPAMKIGNRLDFKPPKLIIPSVECVPYLYSGFKTRLVDLKQSILLSREDTVIYLDTADGSFLNMQLLNATKIIINGVELYSKDGICNYKLNEICNRFDIKFLEAEFRIIKIYKIWID